MFTDFIRVVQDWDAEIECHMRGCESADKAYCVADFVSRALQCVADAGMRKMLDHLEASDGPEMDEASRRLYERFAGCGTLTAILQKLY